MQRIKMPKIITNKNDNKIYILPTTINKINPQFQNSQDNNIEELDLALINPIEEEKKNNQPVEIVNEKSKLTVSTEYITEKFNYTKYQEELTKILNETTGSRNKATAAAIFLATQFPKLPYFWGGGHECTLDKLIGINPNWANYQEIIFGGSDYWALGERFPYSLDCSGFITWCLLNGGYEIKAGTCLNTTTCKQEFPKSTAIIDNKIIDTAQIGDLGMNAEQTHVGIIIDIDKTNKEITFAHMSGSGYGMNITTISTETGLVTQDDLGIIPSVDKNNQPITVVDRIGQQYFSEIIHVEYAN